MLVALAGCASGSQDPFARDAAVSAVDAPDAVPAAMCARQSDCDDRIACTDDACIVGGLCEHTAVPSRCSAGERCDVALGCVSATRCTANAQCDDGVPCTRDLCVAGGACTNVRDDALCAAGQACTARGCVAAGRCTVAADCDDRVFCNGVEQCVAGACAAGSARDCSDGDPCTGDVCNDAAARCDHPAISPCGGGTVAPGTYVLAPDVAYSCGAGTLGPVAAVTLAVTGAAVTVTGFPATLTGSVSGAMFSAMGSESRGGCTWRYTLAGAFTMPGRFTGSYNVAFDACDASLGCFARFGEVGGVLR